MLCQPVQPDGPAASSQQKFRISDRVLARELLNGGGELIADYGAFQFFRVGKALGRELALRPEAEDASEQNVITLNAGPLNTTAIEARTLRKGAGSFEGKRLHLVHFAGPIKSEWHDALKQSGVEVVTYIPHNAYLVYGGAEALSQLQAWAASVAYVQWEGEYLDDYKIHPRARIADAKGQPQKPAADLFAVQLVADERANASTLQVIDRLKLETIRKQARVLNYLNIIVRLPPERLNELATQSELISIQPYPERKKMDERQDQIIADNLSGNTPSGPGYLSWLLSQGFSQSQFTASAFAVDVSDSPIDNGTLTPGHFGLYPSGDATQPSRVIYNRLVGTPNTGSTLQGCDGHGTLNAHIIAGFNDRTNGFPHTDAGGFHYGLGVCPFVKLGSSIVFDTDKFTTPNYANLQSLAYNNGARISNNSWGSANAGLYDIDAQEYDALVRDAQPSGAAVSASGNQEMVIVFASGNYGPTTQTVGSPGTAKNIMSVGASENVRSLSPANGGNDAAGNDGCGLADSTADSAAEIADFSSRGPCTDGRSKPDLVAPGTHVTGGVAQTSPAPSPNSDGSALGCFDGSGVCGLQGGGATGSPDNFFPLGQQFYTTSSGTSHSTPAIAGACALLRQYFINLGSNPPSPAMTKAWLINSARYLNGSSAGALWSASQGMGELNLGMAFDGSPRIIRDELAADKFTATGQTRSYIGTISDPTRPLRVTLAWTDAPGNTTGNAYNNNLDLTVIANGNSYKGNVFSGAYSVTGGAADSRNNVESVFLPAGISGSFTVTVTAANINSDGVPNTAPALDQDFALVIYNGLAGIVPVIVADSAIVTAESCPPANGAVDPGETVSLDFALRNVGASNTVNLAATLQTGGGVNPAGGTQTYGALEFGGQAISKSFTFSASGNCGDNLSATLQLEDGGNNLGTIAFTLPFGQNATLSTQSFDSVTFPNLPSGWTSSATGAQSNWRTSSVKWDTAPNAAYSSDATNIGLNQLVSPPISLTARSAQLTFRHSYDLENTFDGGVLEIQIGNAPFKDILSAGGSFVTGGYSHVLSSSYGNPLSGRQAWTGTSGGFITTTVLLPSAAMGQAVQFRWACGTDSSFGNTGWYVDSVAIIGRQCCGDNVPLLPLIQGGAVSIATENCQPTNNAVDPGETVTLNLDLQNIGSANSSNLIAVLLQTNGVMSPTGPQTYGALAVGGAAVSRPFSFTAAGTCGDVINPVLQLQDGSFNLGTATFAVQLGQLSNPFSQNFDAVTAPALPSGWTTTTTGAQSLWVTTTSTKESPPNSAFSADPGAVGVNELVTPPIALPNASLQLSFRNNYALEAGSGITGFDGGVLEIKVGSGSFVDILSAGGSFVSGGYSHVISSSYGNPLAGRQAWSGNSGGFVTTVASLPAAASGQTIQLRWRCGSDQSVSGKGWYIDTVALYARNCCGNMSLANAPTIVFPQITNGNLSFIISGNPGQNYEIQTTTNLLDWLAIASLTNATGQAAFTETNSSSLPFRAYRARAVPQ